MNSIHCFHNLIRDAYQKINSLCMNPNTSDVSWMQLVENTNWPSMIRLILSASWQTAFHVHYNRLPVLVHCSVSAFLLHWFDFFILQLTSSRLDMSSVNTIAAWVGSHQPSPGTSTALIRPALPNARGLQHPCRKRFLIVWPSLSHQMWPWRGQE